MNKDMTKALFYVLLSFRLFFNDLPMNILWISKRLRREVPAFMNKPHGSLQMITLNQYNLEVIDL